jgi:uncharacterized protein YndB with AHSA1/START domain
MADNEIVIRASCEEVWAVLADPKRYAEWVVGAQSVRAADGTWPEPGSQLHHSTGVGPATIDDSTRVLESDAPTHLKLLAHLGPLGSFEVDLRLEQAADGLTHVHMHEEPVEGISTLAGWPGDVAGRVRNKLSLARLKELAEQ